LITSFEQFPVDLPTSFLTKPDDTFSGLLAVAEQRAVAHHGLSIYAEEAKARALCTSSATAGGIVRHGLVRRSPDVLFAAATDC